MRFKKTLLSGLLGAQFSPASLFLFGEQGVWYDPSDWSTLFQDAAGMTPVTAVGQQVGLMLDKRLGLVRSAEKLVNSSFDAGSVGWTNPDTAPSSTTFSGGGATMTAAPGSALARLRQSLSLSAGTYEVIVNVSGLTGTPGASLALGNASSGDTTYASIQITGNGRYTRIITVTGPTLGLAFTAGNINGGALTIDSVSVRELPGNHATQPTAINRPILQQDANGRFYLAFNGTNQWMSTAAIDFSGTDKMTVVAGVTAANLTTGVIGMVVNHNTTGFNAFSMQAPSSASGGINLTATGSTGALVAGENALPTPLTAVLTGLVNLSAPSAILRRNGVQRSSSASVTGGGTFTNNQMFIGVMTGATQRFFNGQLHGLVVRGTLSTDAQLTSAERWMNPKTGAW